MAEESRIAELSAAIRYHRELYYNHSAPEISDADFDKLWDELKAIEKEHTGEFITPEMATDARLKYQSYVDQQLSTIQRKMN